MDILEELKARREVFWRNPYQKSYADINLPFSEKEIDDAEELLQRFAPVIEKLFPETVPEHGLLESPLRAIPRMAEKMKVKGKLYIKLDSELKVSGSVKARGGIYEVLKHSEELALEHGLLDSANDDHLKLITEEGRTFFKQYKVQVGSTGNLGLSIGTMAAALGFHAIVHMSADAKEWKKKRLREKGAEVIEYAGDYEEAVAQGRRLSGESPYSYFVDDENSKDLFLGYATAAKRLAQQLKEENILVDEEHPLYVYLPCGVGGAPGGITYGLKICFRDDVSVYFAEPVEAPCMLAGIASEKFQNISVKDLGLRVKTVADGLAVGRCSALSAPIMKEMISGEATVHDACLNAYLRDLWQMENIFIEPSSCAAFKPLEQVCNSKSEKEADTSTHIVWATGGSMVPNEERQKMLDFDTL